MKLESKRKILSFNHISRLFPDELVNELVNYYASNKRIKIIENGNYLVI